MVSITAIVYQALKGSNIKVKLDRYEEEMRMVVSKLELNRYHFKGSKLKDGNSLQV